MRSLEDNALLVLVIVVSLAFAWILWPFFGAVLWAAVLAIVFAPLHRRLLKSMPKQHNLEYVGQLVAGYPDEGCPEADGTDAVPLPDGKQLVSKAGQQLGHLHTQLVNHREHLRAREAGIYTSMICANDDWTLSASMLQAFGVCGNARNGSFGDMGIQ